MIEYRGHTSRWQVVKTICLSLFCLALATFNGFYIYEAAATGTIKLLKRRSYVAFNTEPEWFVFNVLMRLFIVLVCVAGLYIIWRQRLRPELRNL